MNVTERRPFVGLLGKGGDLAEIFCRDVFCRESSPHSFYGYSKERRHFTLLLKRKASLSEILY